MTNHAHGKPHGKPNSKASHARRDKPRAEEKAAREAENKRRAQINKDESVLLGANKVLNSRERRRVAAGLRLPNGAPGPNASNKARAAFNERQAEANKDFNALKSKHTKENIAKIVAAHQEVNKTIAIASEELDQFIKAVKDRPAHQEATDK